MTDTYTPVLTGEQIDQALDAVLRASGSNLRNYTMPETLDKMRLAARDLERIAMCRALEQAAAIADRKARVGVLRSLKATHKADAAREIATAIRALQKPLPPPPESEQ